MRLVLFAVAGTLLGLCLGSEVSAQDKDKAADKKPATVLIDLSKLPPELAKRIQEELAKAKEGTGKDQQNGDNGNNNGAAKGKAAAAPNKHEKDNKGKAGEAPTKGKAAPGAPDKKKPDKKKKAAEAPTKGKAPDQKKPGEEPTKGKAAPAKGKTGDEKK